MARKATGQALVRRTKRGRVYALRFRAYGKRQYLTLGTAEDGWDSQRAEVELANVLADVRRGIWQPPRPESEHAEPEPVQTFHQFASAWLRAREPELAPKTIQSYGWALSHHLLPHFKDHLLSEITVEAVDRYKAAKLREGRIGPNQINTTLTRLAQVLEDAVEYGHLERNPARGRRRRVKTTKPRRSWVEPEQLSALLEAATDWHRPLLQPLPALGYGWERRARWSGAT